MLSFKKYVRAQSLEEAYQLNQRKRNQIMGGGMWIRLGNRSLDTVIDLCDLGLDRIEETEDSFTIGAMVTLRQLEMHPGLNAYTHGAVSNAVKDIVGVQFRNGATVGGSVFGRFGFSDVLTVLLTMDCQVELYHGGIVPLEEFARQKKQRDVLVNLIIRKTPGVYAYQAMRHERTDFPILTCAAAKVDGEYRLAVGARPGRAVLLRDEQGILSGELTADNARIFAAWAAERIPTEGNLRGSAAYRSRLAEVLTERTMLELGGM